MDDDVRWIAVMFIGFFVTLAVAVGFKSWKEVEMYKANPTQCECECSGE